MSHETISGIKANVVSLLKMKYQRKLDKQKNPMQQIIKFDDKSVSCQVTRYPTTPASFGPRPVSNVSAAAAAVLGTTATEGGEEEGGF